ncbi:hypothetical protein TSUD_118260 [Trifolium subterraneum]|uniref:Uncharacterized protein n=1 Tax=Trifolium subterraneum TaxID=3900 RepID=A0A2Z6N968_TRISU|nr:hypothetical protein TSUD_118260 [Trifolium subterraneum]
MSQILAEFQFKAVALSGRGILITVLWEGKYDEGHWVATDTLKLMVALKTKEVGKADALKLWSFNILLFPIMFVL